MSFRYRAYGLQLDSELELPGVTVVDATQDAREPDVTVRLGAVETSGLSEYLHGRRFAAFPGCIIIEWEHVGAFRIEDGRSMVIAPHAGVCDDVVRLYVLGAALALLLHQRNLGVFHGSAAEIDGQAVVFVGEKGWGKSTLALSLADAGHSLISDDVTAFTWRNEQPGLVPGTPLVKVWPQTVEASGRDLQSAPALHDRVDKRGLWISTSDRDFVPLVAIYVLDRGPSPKIVPVIGRAAWSELMPHWFAARYGEPLLRALGLEKPFQACARLAGRVAVARLERERDLEALPDLVKVLEQHVAALCRS